MMGSLIRQGNIQTPLSAAPSSPRDFFETTALAYADQRNRMNVGSESYIMGTLRDERNALFEASTGQTMEDVYKVVGVPLDREDSYKKLDTFIERGRQLQPEVYGKIKTTAELQQEAVKRVTETKNAYENGLYTSGFSEIAGSLVGSAGGYLADPVQAATVIATGIATPQATVARGVLAMAAREAAINAGVTAVEQIPVMAWNEKLGLEYGLKDAAANVLLAAGFGAAVPVAAKGVKKISNISPSDALARISDNESLPVSVRNAAAYFERFVHIDEANPIPKDVPNRSSAHFANVAKAEADILASKPVELPPQSYVEQPVMAPSEFSAYLEQARMIKDELNQYGAVDINKPATLKAQLGYTPDSLSQFIRKAGGIQEYAGELASRGITNKSLPGLVRKGELLGQADIEGGVQARQVDYVKEAVFDAGYFPEKTDYNEITDSELFDAISNDLKGQKQYARGDWEKVQEVLERVGSLDEYGRYGITNNSSVEEIAQALREAESDVPFFLDEPPVDIEEVKFEMVDAAAMADIERLAKDMPDFKIFDENGMSVTELLQGIKADETYLNEIRTCAL